MGPWETSSFWPGPFEKEVSLLSTFVRGMSEGSQVAERLWNRASNLKVAGSIPGCAK